MMEHAALPSSLTDGRQASSGVCVGGYQLRLNAGDFISLQARGKFAFKASMANMSLMRTRTMDLRNSPATVNVSVLYNAQPVQFHGQNSPVEARVLHRIPQAFSLLWLERLLRSLALDAMPRSRGVPRRGGRSGIRADLSHLDLQQAVPISSVPPSSPLPDLERQAR